MRFDYVSVPWSPDDPEPQPEARRELEELGFRLLGGCALAQGMRRNVEKLAQMYADTDSDELRRWAMVPGQVLASPDGTAFAHLARLWACRHVTLTSILVDGTLVQTTAEWGALPRLPKALQGRERKLDATTEQRSLLSDPAAEIVAGPMDDLWAAHRRRLTAVPADRLATHTRVDDFVAVYQAESRARSRWAVRMPAAALALSFAVLLVPYLLVASIIGARPWWVDSALVLAAGIGTLVLYQALWPRTRGWRWLRPDVWVPVPGGGTSPRMPTS